MSAVRLQDILNLAKSQGVVTVDDLTERFDVTPQTIRRDLNQLCEEGTLLRTHGGARIASNIENVAYEARRILAGDEKRAIGETVAQMIPNGSSLFMNIGTTTENCAIALLQHRDLMIITNNINVASILRPSDANKVIIASGEVRSSDGGIIGESAVDFIGQFKVDYAIIGASGLDNDGALLDFDYREVKVSQAIIENARHVILVADSSKHERVAPVRIGHVSQIDSFVTDVCPNDEYRSMLASFDVELTETNRTA
ncbi:UNVERIFIED_CONTAM: hypothetical protein GTU68_003834 [Idotea baltica]|nr:hypothetical protein [Idotea baltica]